MEGIAKSYQGWIKIPHSDKWTSYVWYSDQKTRILKEQALLVQTDNSKFIIEALLHDGVSKAFTLYINQITKIRFD